ncbi:hypothetical protein B0T13DRAFT_456520 [Neurospora crassa]|nr:hypothetical protein B0T13DRAFT_456520 [Neurospora crassa]
MRRRRAVWAVWAVWVVPNMRADTGSIESSARMGMTGVVAPVQATNQQEASTRDWVIRMSRGRRGVAACMMIADGWQQSGQRRTWTEENVVSRE